jgi:hypothetical protein
MVMAMAWSLIVGCSPLPPVPTLAPTLYRDALEPRAISPDPALGLLADGPDRNITTGQCKGLPAGIWVSERTHQLRTDAVIERNRLRVDYETLRKLAINNRAAAIDLERAGRERAIAADKRAELRFWLGITIGAGSILAGSWAASQVVR